MENYSIKKIFLFDEAVLAYTFGIFIQKRIAASAIGDISFVVFPLWVNTTDMLFSGGT